MARIRTTVSIEEDLLDEVRIRAARSGKSRSEVVEEALQEGLGEIERLRATAGLGEREALDLAGDVVHEVRRSAER